MRAYELLQYLSEQGRIGLLLNLPLSEVLEIAEDVDVNTYKVLFHTLTALNHKLNKRG